MHPSWEKILQPEFDKDYMLKLRSFVHAQRLRKTVYPKSEDVFNAFKYTIFPETKVVILGQDPYHRPNQAHGLSFSVPEHVKIPASLRNIYQELYADLGIVPAAHGNLIHWARQGVLLLNAVLTVNAGEPGSHQNCGWEEFTDSVISKINEKLQNVVFLLWGKYAAAKIELIDSKRHTILTAAHPSPFSAHRGFFGCRHFSKTNDVLEKAGKLAIDWALPVLAVS